MPEAVTRETLYRAAIACGHCIDEDAVLLQRDPSKPGNALSQLADRLAEVAQKLAPPAHTPERLMEIARATGLREHMHGVPPPQARHLLAAFYEAASRPDAPVSTEPKVEGVREELPAGEAQAWMPLVWRKPPPNQMYEDRAYIRVDLLNEEQAQANHCQSLERLRQRGGLNPNEALAIIRRVPCRPSINEADAFRALVLQVQRIEGASA